MDSTAYKIPVVLSEDGLSHIPLPQGQQLAPWSVPVGSEGDYISPSDLISKEPNNPLILDAAGKLKVDMSRIINPSDAVLYIQNNLVSTQLGMELDNSQLILTGVNNTPIATVSLPVVPGLPTVAEFLHNFTPAPSDNVSGGRDTGTYLHLRFAMSNGETKDIYVNYSDLDVEDYKVSYGLTLDNHIIGLKLAPNSGLSVTSQGLSVSGAYAASDGIEITPQRAISVRAGTGLTFNSGELQALPYMAGTGISITNRVVAMRLANNGGLMVVDGELAVKLAEDGYLVKSDAGLAVSDELLAMVDGSCDEAMARANEAYDLAEGLGAQITGAYEAAESAANDAELAQTQAAAAITVANGKADQSSVDANTQAITELNNKIDNLPDIRPFKTDIESHTDDSDNLIHGNILYIYTDGAKEPGSQGLELHSVYRNLYMIGCYLEYSGSFNIPANDNTSKIPDTRWVNQRIQNAINNLPAIPEVDLSEIEAAIATKADASDLLALETTVSPLPAKIDSNTAAIASLTSSVNSKADSSTVEALEEDLNNKVDRSGDSMHGEYLLTGQLLILPESLTDENGYDRPKTALVHDRLLFYTMPTTIMGVFYENDTANNELRIGEDLESFYGIIINRAIGRSMQEVSGVFLSGVYIPDADNSRRIPDTAWVNQRIQTAIDNLPAIPEVDLSEIEAALETKADSSTVTALTTIVNGKADASAVQALSASLNNKVDRTGDTMTGPLTIIDGGYTEALLNLQTQSYNGHPLDIFVTPYPVGHWFSIISFIAGSKDDEYKKEVGYIKFSSIEEDANSNESKKISFGIGSSSLSDDNKLELELYEEFNNKYLGIAPLFGDNHTLIRENIFARLSDIDSGIESLDFSNTIAAINNRIDAIGDINLSEIEAALETKADSSTVQTLSADLNNKVSKSGDTMTGSLKVVATSSSERISSLSNNSLYFSDNFFPSYSADDSTGDIRSIIASYSYKQDSSSIAAYLGIGSHISHNWKHLFGFNVLSYLQPSLDSKPVLGIEYNVLDNTVRPFCKTPSDTSNDTSVANTEWVNQRVPNLVFGSDGLLPITKGGTGRNDGVSLNVLVTKANGTTDFAKSLGQIGSAKALLADTHADSVIDRGLYICQGYRSPANGYPEDSGSYVTFMEVFHQGNYIVQRWEIVDRLWQRRSTDRGVTWGYWYPIGGIRAGNINLYISKSGNDNNTGLSSSYPCATFNRAFQIADVFAKGKDNINVYFRVGEGDWGNLIVADKPYSITITPYDGQTPTAYSSSLPVFGDLQAYNSRITVTGLVIGYLRSYDFGKVIVNSGYKRIAWFQAAYGIIEFVNDSADTNVLEMSNNGNTLYNRGGFIASSGGIIAINALKIKLTSALNYTAFLYIGAFGRVQWSTSASVTVSGGSLTGKKYLIDAGGSLVSGANTVGKPAFLDTLPGTQAGQDFAGSIYNGIPKGLLSAVAS